MHTFVLKFNTIGKSLILTFVLIGTLPTEAHSQNAFITTWVTTLEDTEITLTVDPDLSYNYDVDWNGDGIYDTLNAAGAVSHDYGSADTNQIAIRGTYPHITFHTSPDKEKLISVDQWGNQQWSTMERAFQGCVNVQVSHTAGTPKLDSVTDLSYMFAGCTSFNSNINSWNVESVENVSHLFEDCISFNQPLGDWDLIKANNLSYVFSGCTSFNQTPFNNLVGDEVYTLGSISASYAFYNCVAFDQPVPWFL